MTPLPEPFKTIPIAHRGYHDRDGGILENSLSSVQAAVTAGYGIEIDIQPSQDGVAMVFHDYALDRLTDQTGAIAQRTAKDLSKTTLKGMSEHIPTLSMVLKAVSGKVPLLIELKDQDGQMGANTGSLEQAVAQALHRYQGDVAVMSFNPHSVQLMAEYAPQCPRGLITCAYDAAHWPLIPEKRRNQLRDIPNFDATGASFISHEAADLRRARVAELRTQGAAILCWTIRSEAQEADARQFADNITFEGYAARLPNA